ncbi:hypothetical protein MHYP_G00148200 [Metynnis hypsauchen]
MGSAMATPSGSPSGPCQYSSPMDPSGTVPLGQHLDVGWIVGGLMLRLRRVLFIGCWPLCAGGRVDFPCCASVPGDYSAPLGRDSFSAFGGWAGLHWERWYQAGPLSFSQTACEVRLTTP